MSVKDALASLIHSARKPDELLRLAAELRELAALLEKRADAQIEQTRRPSGQRLTVRKPQAGPGRTPGKFVRIVEEAGGIRLYIGRGYWYDIGSPKRVDLQSLDGRLTIIPVDGEQGFAVLYRRGTPRVWCRSARDLLQRFGEFHVLVHNGTLILD